MMAFLGVLQWLVSVLFILAGMAGFMKGGPDEAPGLLMAFVGIALLPLLNRFITDNKRRAAKYGAVMVFFMMAGAMMPPQTEQQAPGPAAVTETTLTPAAVVSSATSAPKAVTSPKATATPVKTAPSPKETPKPTAKPTPKASKAPAAKPTPSIQDQINALYTQADAQPMGPVREAIYLKATQVEPSDAFHYYMAAENANVDNRPRDAIRYLSKGLEVAGAHPKKNANHFARLYGQRGVSFKEVLDCKSYERDMRLSCKYDRNSPDCPGDENYAACPSYVAAVKEELARKGMPLP